MRGVLAETGGRLDVLVNNAGYYAFGPARGDLARRAARPARDQRGRRAAGDPGGAAGDARARTRARIVNLSSISGLVVVPGGRGLPRSKCALEALTEALRYEVSGLRHPGGAGRAGSVPDRPARQARCGGPGRGARGRPTPPLMRAYEREAGQIRRGDPADVAEIIFRAATRARPRLRWQLGPTSFTGGVLRRFVPDRLYEARALGVSLGRRVRRLRIPVFGPYTERRCPPASSTGLTSNWCFGARRSWSRSSPDPRGAEDGSAGLTEQDLLRLGEEAGLSPGSLRARPGRAAPRGRSTPSDERLAGAGAGPRRRSCCPGRSPVRPSRSSARSSGSCASS